VVICQPPLEMGEEILGSGHGHYLFSSPIEYYLYIPNFIEIEQNFLWTDGHTDGRTEIWKST